MKVAGIVDFQPGYPDRLSIYTSGTAVDIRDFNRELKKCSGR